MASEFRIRIAIDGRQAVKEASALRQQIATAIAAAGDIKFDVGGINELVRGGLRDVQIGGSVNVAGLVETADTLAFLREQTTLPLVYSGQIDIAGLATAREHMQSIREDAGAIGRAIGAGLGRQWESLETKLVDLQSQITGIVRAGEGTQIAPDMLEAMPELEAALSSGEKKALDLTLRMGDLNARIRTLNDSFAELGQVRVRPLAGGEVRTLGELFKGVAEPYHRRKIRRMVEGIDEELAPLADQTEAAIREATRRADAAAEGLTAQIAEIQSRMEEMLARRPAMPSVAGTQLTAEQAEWQTQFQALETQYLTLSRDLANVRQTAMQEEAAGLQDQLYSRRLALERPMQDEFRFWQEWSMGSVEEIAQALRSAGQSAAADALSEMQGVFEERKRLQTQLKRAFGGIARGAEVELPKGAKGTMVDFIAAERSLGQVVVTTTEGLVAQGKAIATLVKQMDQAAMSAEGMGKTERYALERIEMVGRREMRAATKAGVPLEEAAESVQAVLAEITQSAQQMRGQMLAALSDPEIAGSATKSASGVVKVWEWVRDRLVGRSIIPDMVRDIEGWLALIGEQSPFLDLVIQGETAAQQVSDALSRIAVSLPAEQLTMQIGVLEMEIVGLTREMDRLSVSGSQASAEYRQAFQETAELVRQVLGSTAEVEAKLAQGMLPKGFKVGARESIWQKGGGEARARYGGLEREGDVWYQALRTDIEDTGRRHMAELDRLSSELVQKQAQLAVLQEAQLQQVVVSYEQAATQAEVTADPGAAERLSADLVASYDRLAASQEGVGQAIAEVNAQIALQAEQEAEEIAAEARAYARTPAGRAAAEAAKAEAAERIAAARAEAEVVKQEARAATAATIEEEKRRTAAAQAEARQRAETVKLTRAEWTAEARAGSKEREEAARRETVSLRAQVTQREHLRRVTEREAKAQERLQRMYGQAEQVAARLGIQWDTYVQKALDAGVPLERILGTLQKIAKEQGQVNRQVGDLGGRGVIGRLDAFGSRLSKSRMEAHGLYMVLGDLNNASRTIQYVSAGIVGSLTMAGRSYIDLARQADVASRSLMLSRDLTLALRREVVGMSADLALVDPEQTAKGVTIWAQATGQQVESQADLNRLLQETIPLQQLAALSQENLGSITDGTAAALMQFGLGLGQTNRVTAVFSKVADDTLASVADMTESFKYVGPQASDMGESLEDAAAVMGIMADANVRGSTAGRAYRQMLLSIIEPSKKAQDMLEETFGDPTPFYDAQGAFVGMSQVVDMLAAATENATEQERDLLLSTLFTSNAMPGMTALVTRQIEARERGINVIRAESKLLEGTIDAEVRAYGDLKQEADGITIAMEGAMDIWEKQLDSWEESDVYRVQQMEMRWKGFWLAIGESAVSTALPYIERAADALGYVTDLIQGQPALGALVAVGAGGAALATITRVTLSTVRTVMSLRSIAQALQGTTSAQAQAGTQFNAAVISAAEQFQAIVLGAAEGAAATEEAGAVAETATEEAGAVAEVATEEAGAVAESATEVAGAVVESATEVAGLIAMFAIIPTAIAFAITDALARTEWGEAMGLQTFGKWASVGAYGLGRMVGGEEMGEQWFMSVAGATGELDDQSRAAAEGVSGVGSALGDWIPTMDQLRMSLPVVPREMDGVMHATLGVGDAAEDLTDGLYQLGDSLGAVTLFTDEERRAIDLYVEMLQKQADALDSFNDALQDALGDLEDDLRKLEREFEEEVVETREEANEEAGKAEEEFNRQQERKHRDHLLRMARMEEDHLYTMLGLARDRDAYGMVQERRRYEVTRRRAEEDYAIQAGQEAEDFRRQQTERKRQADERIAEMKREYEAEKAERVAAYEDQVAELTAQHEADMARLEQEYFEKINAELKYYERSRSQQNAWLQAMLEDARVWLGHNRQLWLNYLQSLPTPQYTRGGQTKPEQTGGRRGGRQAGGYISTTGDYAMHAGEFVLNPATVRGLERSLGPLTQERMIAGGDGMRGGVILQASMRLVQDFEFHGSMSAEEREWFRETARSEAVGAFQEVVGGAQRMLPGR